MADDPAPAGCRGRADSVRADTVRAVVFLGSGASGPADMDQELSDHRFQLTGAEDEQVVEYLPAVCASESFGGVRSWVCRSGVRLEHQAAWRVYS